MGRNKGIWTYLYSKDSAGASFALSEKGRDGQVCCLGSGQARFHKNHIAVIRDNVEK